MGCRHDLYGISEVLPVSVCPTIPRRPLRVSLVHLSHLSLLPLYGHHDLGPELLILLATQIRLLPRLVERFSFHR